MLLAIDVGNTQTTIGLFDGEKVRRLWRLHTNPQASTDELHIQLHGLFDIAKIPPSAVDGAALATVVPAATHMWKKVCREMFGIHALMINVKTAGNMIDMSAYRRNDLGADRVADAVAARELYGSPVIVVDFGTATNMEIIDRDGAFAGGIIAPGVQSSMNALFSRAALLPQVELTDPKVSIGRNTVKAMQVGIVYGEIDRVDGLVHRVWEQLGYETKVISTGGLAGNMSVLSKTISEVNTELTLHGIRFIYEYNQAEKKHSCSHSEKKHG